MQATTIAPGMAECANLLVGYDRQGMLDIAHATSKPDQHLRGQGERDKVLPLGQFSSAIDERIANCNISNMLLAEQRPETSRRGEENGQNC